MITVLSVCCWPTGVFVYNKHSEVGFGGTILGDSKRVCFWMIDQHPRAPNNRPFLVLRTKLLLNDACIIIRCILYVLFWRSSWPIRPHSPRGKKIPKVTAVGANLEALSVWSTLQSSPVPSVVSTPLVTSIELNAPYQASALKGPTHQRTIQIAHPAPGPSSCFASADEVQ